MSKKKLERPGQVTDEHLEYLDELRESGATNMFSAGGFVIAQFGVSQKEAQDIVLYWMESFDERHPC